MPKDKFLRYREIRRNLVRCGATEDPSRGKGSHRMFFKVMSDGRKVSFPVPCHNEGMQLHPSFVRRIREAFQLSFEDFYDEWF